MIWPSDLHCDWTVDCRRVARGENILLSEAVPLGWGQDAHRGGARLLEGVVAQGSDGEPAHSAKGLPVHSGHRFRSMHSIQETVWHRSLLS